jgi:hypothetical protein
MSKGEKRVREIVESECMWVLVLPSMPKGEIVGKYLTDNEWHEYRNNVQRIVGVFYRQHILVIDGKYSSNDGLSTTAMISGAVIIREEKQPCSLDPILNSRWPSDLNKSTLKR